MLLICKTLSEFVTGFTDTFVISPEKSSVGVKSIVPPFDKMYV